MKRLSAHWPEYAIEAICLALFMISAAGVATILQHPDSPLAGLVAAPVLQRIPMGIAMGLTAAALIYSPLGARSGAHMNPAVTLTFLRLGKVAPIDAAGYITAQFVGGAAGIALATWALAGLPAHPSINYVATVPGAAGSGIAFAAEMLISFLHDVGGARDVEHPTLRSFHGGRCRRPRSDLHHCRSAILGHEHEPGEDAGLECPGVDAVDVVDLLHGATDRDAVGRRMVHPPTWAHPSPMRQIASPAGSSLHLCLWPLGATDMTSNNRYDVIIIGTGAGGGTLAHRLAPTGKRILLLERGDFVPREKDNWSSRAVNVDAKYHTKEVWTDKTGAPLHPHTNYYVGGNTKFYGAALFRLREADFGELIHSGGASPAWPISYDELEPYYTEAERLYHVHGERGVDPTDPWASAAYPHPAVRHEPRIQQLHDDLARRGLRPFHVPLGIMLDEQNPHAGKCIRCETCDGFPCLIGAKSDAHVVCIEPAISALQRHAVDECEGDAGSRPARLAAR